MLLLLRAHLIMCKINLLNGMSMILHFSNQPLALIYTLTLKIQTQGFGLFYDPVRDRW